MNLNKYINNKNLIPFNYKNSLLVNYFIDDNFSSDPNKDKKILIRLLVSISPNNINLLKESRSDIYKEDDLLIIDIISKEYNNLIVEYETSKNHLFSKVINISYDLKSADFKMDFETDKKESFSLCFKSNNITYELIGSVNKKNINETKTKADLIYYLK